MQKNSTIHPKKKKKLKRGELIINSHESPKRFSSKDYFAAAFYRRYQTAMKNCLHAILRMAPALTLPSRLLPLQKSNRKG